MIHQRGPNVLFLICVLSILLLVSGGAHIADARLQRTPRATRPQSTTSKTPTLNQGIALTATAGAKKGLLGASAEAANAITTYATTVLGAQVVVTKAGGLTTDVLRAIPQTQEGADTQAVVA